MLLPTNPSPVGKKVEKARRIDYSLPSTELGKPSGSCEVPVQVLPTVLKKRIVQVAGTQCLVVRSDLPVGGRLTHFLAEWRSVTSDKWVLEIIEKGLTIDLESAPPFRGLVATRPPAHAVSFMAEEVQALLQKKVIVPVPSSQARDGYYSTYFLVPKKDGGMRPILNLKAFNRVVRKTTFRMETLRSILSITYQGLWLASIDLKDAYLHVPIRPGHSRYLRFLWQGQAYQYRALPFGLTTAPRAFTKVLQPLLAFLRRQGIVLYAYLDDILVVASDPQSLVQAVHRTCLFLTDMGFIVNLKKSDLTPCQDLVYIGARFRTDLGMVFLPPPRRIALIACVQSFMVVGKYRRALLFLRLLGMMAACIDVVRYARLAMRPIQWFLKTRWQAAQGLNHKIMVTRSLKSSLEWWLLPGNLEEGVELQPQLSNLVVTTDASGEGWGGYLHGTGQEPLLIQGEWTVQDKRLHINVLELRAVHLVFRRFESQLTGKWVTLECDNTATVAYVNHQGGVQSKTLYKESWEFFQFLLPRRIRVRAVHRAGADNTLADFLSRHRVDSREWKLCQPVVKQIFQVFGTPMCDLFASAKNHQLPLYYSQMYDPQAAGTDALRQSWKGEVLLYAFPPIALLLKVLNKIRLEEASVVLVAPKWPRRPWYSHLLRLCCGIPRVLPLRRDLLSQELEARGTLFHSELATLQLVVWKLSGNALEVKAFQRTLLRSQPQPFDPLPARSMTPDGKLGVAGVVDGVSIPLMPL